MNRFEQEPSLNTGEQYPHAVDGLFTSSGKVIFESPSLERLEDIRDNPRLEYFRFRFPLPPGWPTEAPTPAGLDEYSIQDHEGNRIPIDPKVVIDLPHDLEQHIAVDHGRKGLGGFFGMYLVYDFIGPRVLQDCGPGEYAVRGVAASLDGTVKGRHYNTRDIREILITGTDGGGLRTTGLSDESPILNFRSLQWLFQSPQDLRSKLAEDGQLDDAHKIFPALLVYDLAKIRVGGVGSEKIKLPESEEERAKVINRVYIFDYQDNTRLPVDPT